MCCAELSTSWSALRWAARAERRPRWAARAHLGLPGSKLYPLTGRLPPYWEATPLLGGRAHAEAVLEHRIRTGQAQDLKDGPREHRTRAGISALAALYATSTRPPVLRHAGAGSTHAPPAARWADNTCVGRPHRAHSFVTPAATRSWWGDDTFGTCVARLARLAH
eukprot:scaffold80141_cov63-Phaeocystis_antarctica.AAC.1